MVNEESRRIWAWIAAIALAFVVGFGWQFVRAQRLQGELDTAERRLALLELENTLGASTLAAQHGGHDVALELASDFFTELQARIDQVPPEAGPELREILAQRDAVIAGLSRADPQATGVLSRLYVRFRIALGGPERALPLAASPPDTL